MPVKARQGALSDGESDDHPGEMTHPALSASQQDAVREQLHRLLASPWFCHSKRLPMFLCFVIDHTLNGEHDCIKERTLGVEIFGRESEYETAADPIVRVTAGEIRKRLAQYYQEPGHEDELRIVLPLGSYVPRFDWDAFVPEGRTRPELPLERAAAQESDSRQAPEDVALGAEAREEASEAPSRHPARSVLAPQASASAEAPASHQRPFLAVAAAVLAGAGLLVIGIVLLLRALAPSPLAFFWGPIFASSEPVLICVADQTPDGLAVRDPMYPANTRWLPDPERRRLPSTVGVDSLNVVVRLTALLQSKAVPYRILTEEKTTIGDLQAGPAIFVGGFDNAWTLRVMSSLRYRFANDPDLIHPRIIDTFFPAKPGWVPVLSTMGRTGEYRDFAIVSRSVDAQSGQLSIVAAGIGHAGSLAAGQFLIDKSGLIELQKAVRTAGNKKNLEVVLSTTVIDGQPGAPKIEAAYSW